MIIKWIAKSNLRTNIAIGIIWTGFVVVVLLTILVMWQLIGPIG